MWTLLHALQPSPPRRNYLLAPSTPQTHRAPDALVPQSGPQSRHLGQVGAVGRCCAGTHDAWGMVREVPPLRWLRAQEPEVALPQSAVMERFRSEVAAATPSEEAVPRLAVGPWAHDEHEALGPLGRMEPEEASAPVAPSR